jgi:hypothetical protein
MSTLRTDTLQTTDSAFTIAVDAIASAADLTNVVDPNKGAAILGRGVFAVANTKDLLAAKQDSTQIAIVKEYFTGSSLGHGLFRWVSTQAKSAHDGGSIISPTVPWDGTPATHAAFLAGTGETLPAGTGCWVRMSETTFATHFGMTTTAASAAIQKMINTGGRKQLPDGTYRLATALARDFSGIVGFPETGDASLRFTLEGQSMSNSILHYAGAGYAMDYKAAADVPVGQSVHSMLELSNFALKPADALIATCSGIRLTNHAYTSLRGLDLEYLDTGLELKSVITCDFERVYVRSCVVGMNVNGSGFSMPNANDFRRFTAQSNSFAGIVANKIGGGFHMQGATIESNGTMGNAATGGFIGNLDGVNGSATLNLTNVYFEANRGGADLLLVNTSPYTVTVVLTNCNFNRTDSVNFTTNNINISNSGGGKVRLVLNGCSFMRGGTYVANAARPYILHDNSTEVIDNGSTYSDAVEMNHAITSAPTTAGRVAAAGTAVSLPVGVTSSKTGTGTYNIVNTIGFGIDANGYVASAVSTEAAGGIKVERITQNSATSFTVVTTNNAGTLTDGAFNFMTTRLS